MSHNTTTEEVLAGLSALDIRRLNYPKWAHQIAGGMLVLIGFFGFVENVLVILTFTKNKRLLSPTNIFILGVAIGDLCMVCLGNPLEFTSAINGAWFAGDAACVLVGFVVYLFGLSQLYLLSAVSVDRYIVITKPLLTHKITTKVACASVTGCFGLALFWAVCPLIGWSSYGLEASGVFCGLNWKHVSVSNTSYVITITIFCFFVPLGIMIFCYYHVFMTVKRLNRNSVWDLNSRMARKNLKLERKMLKSCVIMCGVYWIAWTPYAVVSFIQAFGDPDSVPLWMAEVPATAAKSQVVWNPIIYVGTNKKFRMAFYQSLPCTWLRDWFEVQAEEVIA
ncbi:visual pigment-like receptor peropsin [Dreissena polymorpha]|uniref:visual pigment-like receptor peropsin n=1 Tax=Dreissena polymorpha TaxID=45954 RepID=UPI002264D54F|nr:visual pigment-like receptor peropsin [Dreissena polymorpha]